MRETLFLFQNAGIWFLEDSKHNLIGRFNSQQDAEKWCEKNDYRVRIQK